MRPSAYSVNSCVVADASSWVPSQRKVWLPKITSVPDRELHRALHPVPVDEGAVEAAEVLQHGRPAGAAGMEQRVVPADERVVEHDVVARLHGRW